MPNPHYRSTPRSSYAQGLRDAARLLVSTAEDYEQMHGLKEQELRKDTFMFPQQRATAQRLSAYMQEKAILLRAQAQQILDLEKN